MAKSPQKGKSTGPCFKSSSKASARASGNQGAIVKLLPRRAQVLALVRLRLWPEGLAQAGKMKVKDSKGNKFSGNKFSVWFNKTFCDLIQKLFVLVLRLP